MLFPEKIDIPAAWYGNHMAKNTNLWKYCLTSKDIFELESAADSFKKSNKKLGLINKYEFQLPKLGITLNNLQKELRSGIGFKLIQGLPVDTYDSESICLRGLFDIGKILKHCGSLKRSMKLLRSGKVW